MRWPKIALILSLAMLACRFSFAMEIRGRVVVAQSGCPIAGLNIEIDPEVGSAQAKVFTTTDTDGAFDVRLVDGRYLIQVFQAGQKVYQQVVTGTDIVPLKIQVKAEQAGGQSCLQPTRTSPGSVFTPKFQATRDWRPNDLSYSGDIGLLVLDDYGRVTRIFSTDQGTASKSYFSIDGSRRFIAVASGGNRTFVTAVRPIGCTVFQYDGVSNKLATHLLGAPNGSCDGIATDGQTTVVGFPGSSEIRFFQSSDFSKPRSVGLPGTSTSYNFIYDDKTLKLYVGDSNGDVYQTAFGDGSKPKRVISHAGSINSLAASSSYLLVASGTHVMCYKKTDFSLLNLSGCMDVTLSGQLAGIRVDNQNHAWVLERDRDVIVGPITLK
jgi:hypothetical protein